MKPQTSEPIPDRIRERRYNRKHAAEQQATLEDAYHASLSFMVRVKGIPYKSLTKRDKRRWRIISNVLSMMIANVMWNPAREPKELPMN